MKTFIYQKIEQRPRRFLEHYSSKELWIFNPTYQSKYYKVSKLLFLLIKHKRLKTKSDQSINSISFDIIPFLLKECQRVILGFDEIPPK